MRVTPEYVKLKNLLKNNICEGRFPSGRKIPSRNLLMRKYGFARATVDRAVNELVREGILRGQRGSGTYVVGLKGKKQQQGTVYVVLHRQTRLHETAISPFLEELQDGISPELKLSFITIHEVMINTEGYVRDAVAFIFCQLSPVYYEAALNLQKRNFPVLLMNREDCYFNFITTDRYGGYDKALSDCSGGIGAVMRQVCLDDPYLNEGRAGFFRAISMNPNLHTKPEWLVEMNSSFGCRVTVKKVMDMLANNPPEWLVVDGYLITCVQTTINALGLEIGRDINLVLFEPQEIPGAEKGVILLSQDYHEMGRIALEWLKKLKHKDKFQKYVLPIIKKI